MNRARDIVHARSAYERNIYGEGIGVAIIDTGIVAHSDFTTGQNRIIAFKDVIHGKVNMYDDNGHGTHVSGIVGGNGTASSGKYMGIAPKCNIICVKALNYRGNGNVTDVLTAFDWLIQNKDKYNIRIVNISVGSTSEEGNEESNLVLGVDDLWDRGFIVVVAAGNNGPGPRTISIPGISRKVITVGASDDNVSVEVFGTKTIDYSGRGPTIACVKKPDVVAPGSNIVSCCPPKFDYRGNRGILFGSRAKIDQYGGIYTIKSGTSMSTPIVTGAMALLLSAYPDMTNREAKIRIKNSSTDMGLQHQQQGWGLLNIEKLIP